MRYNDSSGHGPEIPVIVVVVMGAPEILVVAAAAAVVVVLVDAVAPGREQRHAALATALQNAADRIATGVRSLFAKRYYTPPFLNKDRQRDYHDAIERYKKYYGLPGNYSLPKEYLDDIAKLINQGAKPDDVVNELDEPPEGEGGD